MKYYVGKYIVDSKKSDLVAEKEHENNFGVEKSQIFRTKKSKQFFKVVEDNYQCGENNGHTNVTLLTEAEALDELQVNFYKQEINWKKFFELEEY